MNPNDPAHRDMTACAVEAYGVVRVHVGEIAALRKAPGIILVDDPANSHAPMPIDVVGRDEVFVGRVRKDPTVPFGLQIWVVADNLRKGAATNAVHIAQELIKQGIVK